MNSDGFKLSVSAENETELNVVKELTEKLIDKISVIEIKQNNSEEGGY